MPDGFHHGASMLPAIGARLWTVLAIDSGVIAPGNKVNTIHILRNRLSVMHYRANVLAAKVIMQGRGFA